MTIHFFVILLSVLLSNAVMDQNYRLDQVIILSRHNVRTPLAKNLAQMTPKTWPNWAEKRSGYLTAKGALLEGYMGHYFSLWLNENGLLPKSCPSEKNVLVYANSKQRTMASAKAFVEKSFPNCSVPIHHNSSDKTDPIFNPVIHNTTEIFKQMAFEQMQERMKTLQLNNCYEHLENILDYRNSDLCKNLKLCDLTKDKNKIIDVQAGYKPNILGPLKVGNSVIDAFVMQNYEGFSIKNVAWGYLSNRHNWQAIVDLTRGYHNVIFNTTLVASDIAAPLIKYIANLCLNENPPKLTLLMGHDANMYTILNGMKFKPYILPNQHEVVPVGGKIVFQKWHHTKEQIDLLKVNFVYQSTKQMRKGVPLSLENPPKTVTLELRDCRVDDKGYCLWNDFKELLKRLLN